MRRIAIALALLLALTTGAAPQNEDVVVKVHKRDLPAGEQRVVVSAYAAAEGGTALASETRSVRIDERGSFAIPLGKLAAGGRWLGVRLPSGTESPRVPVASGAVTIHVVPLAAITAPGLIESTVSGFRFPDGSIQTSAATVSGGVPSVNGIGTAVTITGAETVNVGTAGSTITVTGPSFGSPVSVGSSNAAGVATTVARADHVHGHGNQSGGTLHAEATAGTAGFLSADDKSKLDDMVAYVRTIIVSPVIGDETASGTALLTALNGISGNSASNPYLLKIEPGVYDIGSSALTMKTHVDIEGSGQNATFINATRGASGLSTSAAAVIGAANAELRQLTVSNDANGLLNGVGVFTTTSASTTLRDVTIASTGAFNTSYGLVSNGSSSLTGIRTTITATGTGGTSSTVGFFVSTGSIIRARNCSITAKGIGGTGTNTGAYVSVSTADAEIDSSLILATGSSGQNTGVFVAPGEAVVMNSTIQVETSGTRIAAMTSASSSSSLKILHSRLLALSTSSNASELSASHGTNSKLHIATSQIDSASAGSPKCVHVYDSDMDDLNNTCPGPIG